VESCYRSSTPVIGWRNVPVVAVAVGIEVAILSVLPAVDGLYTQRINKQTNLNIKQKKAVISQKY